VAIEPSYRVPTTNKWNEVFAVVARPRNLWITADGGRANSYSSQRRVDNLNNMSIGAAGTFSTDGIPYIDKPYQLGETIKIRRLSDSMKFWGGHDIFQSAFYISDGAGYYQYNSWHTQGSTMPYFAGQTDKITQLRAQPIFNPDAINYPYWFAMTLYKYQYEAFFLNSIQGNASLTSYVQKMFGNELPNTNAEYLAHGGYVFKENQYVNFFSVDYEDLNVNNKQRVSTADCMPLIVSTPNTFPTPAARTLSTINYNPTYSSIIKQS
jgi:hypothetical protein